MRTYNKLLKWKLNNNQVADHITFFRRFRALIWLPDIIRGDLNAAGYNLVPCYTCKAYALIKAHRKTDNTYLCEYVNEKKKLKCEWLPIDVFDYKNYNY